MTEREPEAGTGLGQEHDAVAMFRACIDAWSAHRTDRVLAAFADDCVYENLARGMTYRGKEELGAWVASNFVAFPDVVFEATSIFASGCSLACEWVMSGTHAGDLPGLPATGKHFSIRGVSIGELAGGKVVRNTDYWDLAGFLRQLGLMP